MIKNKKLLTQLTNTMSSMFNSYNITRERVQKHVDRTDFEIEELLKSVKQNNPTAICHLGCLHTKVQDPTLTNVLKYMF